LKIKSKIRPINLPESFSDKIRFKSVKEPNKIEKVEDDNKSENVINNISDDKECNKNKNFNDISNKESSFHHDNMFDFGSLVKGNEYMYNFSYFLKEYKRQTKNVDHFYKNQLKINDSKFEKILTEIKNKNRSSVKYFFTYYKIIYYFYKKTIEFFHIFMSESPIYIFLSLNS
jgi:hypothetical protein